MLPANMLFHRKILPPRFFTAASPPVEVSCSRGLREIKIAIRAWSRAQTSGSRLVAMAQFVHDESYFDDEYRI
jgi:hypothetical protein